VIGREMVFEPERVEQALLHHGTLPHHGPILPLKNGGGTIRQSDLPPD
jgi:hypothetical protein